MSCLATLSATKVSAFLHDIESYGVDRKLILNAAKVNTGLLMCPDHRITSAEWNRILQETVRLTNNENIGLLQGERLGKGFSNIVGYVLANCATLREAAEKYCKYEKIVDGTSISEMRESGDELLLNCTALDKVIMNSRQFSDFRIAGILAYTRLLSGMKAKPVEVRFSYKEPRDKTVHERIFECPVSFHQPSDALVFKQKDLELPIAEPNRNLLMKFEEIAKSTLVELGVNGVYTERIINILLHEIKGETPRIDAVASKLSMSVRNLQNCLKKEGTSYICLVNRIRKEIAVNYLKEKSISTDEIAYILGFSESRAFHRAFKRWTKVTPGAYRSMTAV